MARLIADVDRSDKNHCTLTWADVARLRRSLPNLNELAVHTRAAALSQHASFPGRGVALSAQIDAEESARSVRIEVSAE